MVATYFVGATRTIAFAIPLKNAFGAPIDSPVQEPQMDDRKITRLRNLYANKIIRC
jgi:hypothetical protein